MQLKRLEIQGFKSFKDKTVIQFDHSITGIVGPNGCGKSNIVDAFFWVMGEQSYKHMRGNSSSDLIFNGSDKYAPLGFAEATLVLEADPIDKDPPTGATSQDIPFFLRAKEIAVTRRVYRAGEGEYFINGLPVRLKDVQELFMDTGVGTKGYSIIEQGQIGKTVNAKPEERRILIEDAAGISKYKARKKESLRKIEAATQNLARLSDVIQEIEKNLHSLERQAQKARLYRKYKDELLNKEMTWGRRKRKVLELKLENLKNEKSIIHQETEAMRAELQTKETEIETHRIENLALSKHLEEIGMKVQTFSKELTKLQSDLELSKKRQEYFLNQLQTLETEKTRLEIETQSDQALYLNQKELSQKEDSEFQIILNRLKHLEDQTREKRSQSEDIRTKRDNCQNELLLLLSESSELKTKISSWKIKLESHDEQIEKLENRKKDYSEKNKNSLLEKDKTQ
ncbi:MAG: AAA family ATPase, partial [Deltaproteobacteria bacterium]|nr:AAA family ATPase [Deltaproteobacteria bacterium]